MRPVPGDLPARTLGFEVAAWIEDNCVIPDGEQAGEPFLLSPDQLRFIAWFYALDEAGKFAFRRGLLVRPQKWGKGPLSAAIICAEAAGPVRFDRWEDGQPVGRSWATPWIQVVAVSEDQTDNIWTALVPMIELGALKADIPDTGKTRINISGAHGSSGVIEPVTSAHISRLGQRLTFAVHDETGYWTKHNGGHKLADTQRRNLAGMGGRSVETTNAWDPSEESVAQVTFESNLSDVLVDFPEPPKGSIRNVRARRRVLAHSYAGAPWVDLDRIDAEIDELLGRDPGQAERFFLNRVVAGQDKAFNVDAWKGLAHEQAVLPGRLITLGFDGSRRHDATALVGTDIELGYQFVLGLWERPRDADDDWEVPEDEVDSVVSHAFDTWDVWRLYGDPPYWETALDRWAGRYGEERVVRWWTNRLKAMAFALKAWVTDWRDGELSHDGNDDLERHVANSIRFETRMRDEDGRWLWVIRKDGQKSPRKIDAAMAACLSWEARGDALRAGVLDRPQYGRWTDGSTPVTRPGARENYIACAGGCGKPIHPRLHQPGARERGLCLKCRSRTLVRS